MFTQKTRIIIALLAISIVTCLVFLPSLKNGFTNWDDQIYVTDNEIIKDLSFSNVANIFTSFHHGLYKPLVILSFTLEYHFFGLNPSAYHTTNLILHLLNSLLVFWLIYLLSNKVLLSFLTAMLFGIHPLHVESVAWVTERKDMLYALFFLGALISYLYYRRHHLRRYYYSALCLGLVSILAKPMGVILPLILLIIDFIQRRKFEFKLIREKIPFFGISVLAIGINLLALHFDPIQDRQMALVFPESLFYTSYALLFYLKKILVPLGLSCLYPYPEKIFGFLPAEYLFSPVVVIFLTFIVILTVRSTRKAIFGSLFFLIMLLPVIPLVPASPAIAADRYTYVSSIGIFYIFAEGFFWIYKRKSKFSALLKIILIVALSLVLTILGSLTFKRTQVWRDSITLWSDAIKKSSGNLSIPYNNRGSAYMEQEKHEQAISDYNKALESNPGYAKAYNNRGVAYMNQGKTSQALSDYNRSIALDSWHTDAYNNRGMVYMNQGKLEQAIADFDRAIKINPYFAQSYNIRGAAYMKQRNFEQASADFNQAIKLKAHFSEAYNNRGNLYFHESKFDLALSDYSRSIKIRPDYAEAYSNRGTVYARQGRLAEAVSDYNQALKINPRYAKAYNNRGIAYVSQGKLEQAIADFGQAIEIDAGYADAYNNRGAAYAGKGNFERAIPDYSQAIQIDPRYALAYNNRGYAYAKIDSVAQALIDCNKAIELNPKEGNFYDSRAYVFFRRHEYSRSWDDLRKAEDLGYKVDSKFLQELEQVVPRR